MRITVRKDYLVFPVNTHATEKELTFSQKGKTVFTLGIRLDNVSPDFYAYIDVSLFKGDSLEISVSPEMPLFFDEADGMTIYNLYHEAVRPQAHFTVKNGYMGAPEALIRTEDGYALVYPYNPADTGKGNACRGVARSRDLIHWTEAHAPMLPEREDMILRSAAQNEMKKLRRLYLLAEGTEIFPLTCGGKRKWISMRRDGRYLIGNRNGGVFTPEQDEKMLRYGAPACQGVTFADADRALRIEWDSCPTASFCGQMSIPMELSLERDEDGYRLAAMPVGELESIYKSTNRYRGLALGEKNIPLADAAHWLRMQGKILEKGVLTATLFGRELRIDFAENRICADGAECPLSVTGGALDLILIVDRHGVEIFADGGRVYMSCLSEEMFMDRNLLSLDLRCDEPYALDLLEIHAIESIWYEALK
jgi:sucrose-6-phosphate hydrolase SacC (GH32 family)